LTVGSQSFAIWSKAGDGDKVFAEAQEIAKRYREVINTGVGFVVPDLAEVIKSIQ